MDSNWEWIGRIGSIASAVGLPISIYVFWAVRQVRKEFVLRARIGPVLEILRTQTSNISQAFHDFDESPQEVVGIIAECESTLFNLYPKLKGNEKRITKQLAKSLRRYRTPNLFGKRKLLDRDEAWQVYIDLLSVVQSITHLQEDIRAGG